MQSESTSKAGVTRRSLVLSGSAIGAGLALGFDFVPSRARASARHTTWYVSASQGSDANDGSSPTNAFATLSRLNRALDSGDVPSGSAVLFFRGDMFFGQLRSASRIPDFHVTFSHYGDDWRPPVISRYKTFNDHSAWTRVGTDLWRIDMSGKRGGFSGLTDSAEAETGFLNVNSTIFGDKKWTVSQLSKQWDFANDSRWLYVRSELHPLQYGPLSAAVKGDLVFGSTGMHFSGIALEGGGSHGIRLDEKATDVVVSSVEISKVGGARLGAFDVVNPSRYGNGVEIWIGAKDVLIQNCFVREAYDVAFTLQGGQTASARGWNNIVVSGNQMSQCNQNLELWSAGDDTGPGSGYVNCTFEYNNCWAPGFSWSQDVRKDGGKGVHILFYQTTLPCDFDIRRNNFQTPADGYCYLRTTPSSGIRVDNNMIVLGQSQPIDAQITTPGREYPAWTAKTGWDRRSDWQLV